jgi:hypothetical protein
LSSSGSGGITAWDRLCACIVRPWVATWQWALASGAPKWRFQVFCFAQWDEHLFAQAEGQRFSICSSSIDLTFQVALLFEGYSMSVSCDTLLFLRRLDLPKACFCYSSARPPFSQHTYLPWRCVGLTWFWSGRRFFKQQQRIVFTSSLWTCSLEAWCSTSYALRRIFFFGSLCTLHDLTGAMSSLHFNMTSSQPLRLHVDRGLERHGYPWVPTD